MARKTGNMLFLLLAIIPFICLGQNPELFLSAVSANRKSFDYTGRNQPFYLTVQAKNMGEFVVSEKDIIANASKTCVIIENGTSRSTSIINGKRDDSISFDFLVHPTKEGKFRFGPITGTAADGTEVISNSLLVTVSDHPLVHKVKHEPFIFESFVDTKQVFVHQKIVVTYRFFYRQNFDQLQIFDQDYANCVVGFRSKDSPVYTKNIDGQEFNYREWTVELYPETPGLVEILPARAQYVDATSGIGSFGVVFGNVFADKNELYSKAMEIDVLPLPPHPEGKDVAAVGSFDTVCFEVDGHVAEVGKGVVAKYRIIGNGNVGMIKFPKLDLPESIRYYSSTESVKKIKEHKREKLFEAIVQGSEPGEFTIPRQRFDYFDPESKSYKLLWTDPVELSFFGEALVKKEIQEENESGSLVNNVEEKEVDLFEDWQIRHIYSGSAIHAQSKSKIPAGYFLLLLFFLVLSLVAWNLWKLFISHLPLLNSFLWFQKHYALFQLRRVKNKNNARNLHRFFEIVFQYHNVDIYNQSGIDMWEKIGASDLEKDRWKKLVEKLHRAVYMDGLHCDYDQLHGEAKAMIVLFYQKIKKSKGKR